MLLASNISKSLSVQLDCKVRTENRLFLICDTDVTVCFFHMWFHLVDSILSCDFSNITNAVLSDISTSSFRRHSQALTSDKLCPGKIRQTTTDQTTTDGFWQKEVKDIFKRDFVFLELHVIQRFKHNLDKPQ